jgi:hypothetical protein
MRRMPKESRSSVLLRVRNNVRAVVATVSRSTASSELADRDERAGFTKQPTLRWVRSDTKRIGGLLCYEHQGDI